MTELETDGCGNAIAPNNPWPIGCEWWFRTNEQFTRDAVSRNHLRRRNRDPKILEASIAAAMRL